jgi:hypothetical protein
VALRPDQPAAGLGRRGRRTGGVIVAVLDTGVKLAPSRSRRPARPGLRLHLRSRDRERRRRLRRDPDDPGDGARRQQLPRHPRRRHGGRAHLVLVGRRRPASPAWRGTRR